MHGNPNTDVKADVTLPENLSVSAFSRLNDKWDLMGDVTWTRWSQFEELKIVRDNGYYACTYARELGKHHALFCRCKLPLQRYGKIARWFSL